MDLITKTLTQTEKHLLPKGLNSSVKPRNVLKVDIVASIEHTAQKLIMNIEFDIKLFLSNINRKTLQQGTVIKTLPAVKGHATVVKNNKHNVYI